MITKTLFRPALTLRNVWGICPWGEDERTGRGINSVSTTLNLVFSLQHVESFIFSMIQMQWRPSRWRRDVLDNCVCSVCILACYFNGNYFAQHIQYFAFVWL